MTSHIDSSLGQPLEVARVVELEGSQSAGAFLGIGLSFFASRLTSKVGFTRGGQMRRSGSSKGTVVSLGSLYMTPVSFFLLGSPSSRKVPSAEAGEYNPFGSA